MAQQKRKSKTSKKNKRWLKSSPKVLLGSIFVLVFAGIGSYLLWHSLAASTVGTLSASGLTSGSAVDGVISTAGTSSGQAFKIIDNVAANGTLSTSDLSASITLRARGDQCKGSPQVSITIDDKPAMAVALPNSWANYTANFSLLAGNHTVSVRMTNPLLQKSRCIRAVYIDTITALGSTVSTQSILYDSNRTGNYEVYNLKSDGTSIQLTNDTVYDSWWPKASPDGKQVLFYRTPKGKHDTDYSATSLWMMNIDGSNTRQIIANGAHGWVVQGHAEWSPDGSKLTMLAGTGGTLIITTDLSGSSITAASTPYQTQNTDPAWHPDGKHIVYTYKGDVWRASAVNDGSTPVRLTSDSYVDYDPYYSADGSKIALLTKVSDDPTPGGTWGIRLMNSDGTNLHFIINDGNINSKPEWSPDGGTIYFHRHPTGIGTGFFGLWKISPDGSNLMAINAGSGSNEYPDLVTN